MHGVVEIGGDVFEDGELFQVDVAFLVELPEEEPETLLVGLDSRSLRHFDQNLFDLDAESGETEVGVLSGYVQEGIALLACRPALLQAGVVDAL